MRSERTMSEGVDKMIAKRGLSLAGERAKVVGGGKTWLWSIARSWDMRDGYIIY